MIHGELSRAIWNNLRTRAAPTPTYISMNSDPDMAINDELVSPAADFANSVLPVPKLKRKIINFIRKILHKQRSQNLMKL